MSDSESSKSGSDSSSGSESSSSQSSSSVSSRSSASSKRSAELQRERQGVQESSSDSENSHSSDSSRSSKSSKSSNHVASKKLQEATSSSEGSSSDSKSSRSEKGEVKTRRMSVSSGSTRTSRTTTSDNSSDSSDSELGRDSARPKEQDGSSSSSESATSTHTSSDSSSDSDSSSSSSSDSESSGSEKQTADRDTIRIEKKAVEPIKETQIKVEMANEDRVKVERRNSIDHMDAEEDPAIANNPWVKLGKFFDRFWFHKLFVPITGTFTIFLLVVFSILLDIRVSGEKGLPYGISFIFILIGLLFWTVVLVCMGLSRVRYALNIQIIPENGSLFEKSVLNKEGARIGAFWSFAIALILLWVYTILISVHVDKPKWTDWHEVFIPLWIALGFIGLGITFSARLLKSYVTLFFHIAVTASMTAMCIVIYNKIQGNIGTTWYKSLVPLWFFDFFVCIFLLWHTASRIVSAIPHFVPIFSKSKKEREPDTIRDSLASIPLSIAGMFMLLFQVTCVIKTENVFIGKYHVTWSVIWLWWWLACAFATAWCWMYKYKTTANRTKRVSKV